MTTWTWTFTPAEATLALSFLVGLVVPYIVIVIRRYSGPHPSRTFALAIAISAIGGVLAALSQDQLHAGSIVTAALVVIGTSQIFYKAYFEPYVRPWIEAIYYPYPDGDTLPIAPSLTDADLKTIATLVDRAAAQRETQAGAP